MRISYNAPFVLTFSLASFAVLVLNVTLLPGITANLFTVYPGMSWLNPLSFVRLFTHVVGHANLPHFVSNFVFILLLGPILEEKYGTSRLFVMAVITALITGLLNNFLFTTGLLGASGIVFMFILLASFSNFRSGEIPLTFILVMLLFLGREVFSAMNADNISQFAHIVGGVCGSIFGFNNNTRA